MSIDNVAAAKNNIRTLMFALSLLPREGDGYHWRESVASGAFHVNASLPSGKFCASVMPLENGGAYYDAWVEVQEGRVATLCSGSIGEPRQDVGILVANGESKSPH